MGITHIEEEMGLQPRTFAEKRSLFPTMDAELDRYETEKAFWITGIIKDDVLKKTRAFIFNWTKEHPGEASLDEGFEAGLYEILREWIPTQDASGRTINQAARAEVIARTNIMDIYNHARLSMMQVPELRNWVVAFRFSAIIDMATTMICRSLHGKIFTRETLNGYNPPLHYNCRSVLLPVTQLDHGWQTEMGKQGQVTVTPQDGFATSGRLPPVQEAATGQAKQ
jgi:SPP1 gp7 family putative phage head morphogenesis protein